MLLTHRSGPVAVRTLTLAVCLAGVVALAGCSPDSDSPDSGSKDRAPSVTSPPAGSKQATAGTSSSPPAVPAGKGSSSQDGKVSASPVPVGTPAAPSAGSTASAGAGGEDDGCDHKMPISPDEIAVYRYTPEGGSLSLIVRHGNWGCGTPDSDGAPFEPVGKETSLPMSDAAYVTVTDPIVASTENQPISVQKFIDWLEAHPDSGLVFRYHLGSDGAVDRLEQVFTP